MQQDARRHPLIPDGTVIRDTYTVDGFIASGAFADVYRVRHRYMGMQAMKVLRDGQDDQSRTKGLFEAFHLSRISHPAIVRVFDGNCLEAALGGFPYVTMELVEGGTMADLHRSTGRRFVSDLIGAAGQLASALGHAHSQGPAIIHRDVKPSNVLVSRRQCGALEVRLADFGLAVPIDLDLGFATGHGTISYRAPESLDGFEVPASDVYSWGLTVYEAATGIFPFRARLRGATWTSTKEFVEALRLAQSSELDPPSYFRHEIHPSLDAIVTRTLHADRRMRIQDGCALLEAVDAVRDAIEGDPHPSDGVRSALQACGDPRTTYDAVDLLASALRTEAPNRASYVRLLGFLRRERERLAA